RRAQDGHIGLEREVRRGRGHAILEGIPPEWTETDGARPQHRSPSPGTRVKSRKQSRAVSPRASVLDQTRLIGQASLPYGIERERRIGPDNRPCATGRLRPGSRWE